MLDGGDIKELRRTLGISQKELAQKLGVSTRTIANYEAGGVIPVNKRFLFICLLSNTNSINIKGDSNITNTGNTGANVIISSSEELLTLKKRIKQLEEENEQLKKDKAILQEFVTFLQNKK